MNETLKNNSRYEDRIIAFIDILGFKKKIEDTISGDNAGEQTEKIKNIYDFITLIKDDFHEKHFPTIKSYQVTHFSDSLVISCEASEKAAVFIFLMGLLYLQIEAVAHGFLLRGAVTNGKLIHDDTCLFGPAMLKAYKIESEIAKYPRIIVEKEVIDLAYYNSLEPDSGKNERHVIKSLLKKDSDNLYYINYINEGAEEVAPEYLQEYCNALKKIIKINNNKHKEIKEKICWLDNKCSSLFKKQKKEESNNGKNENGVR